MAKNRTLFVCQECGHNSAKWLGRCPGCNSWNSLVEEVVADTKKTSVRTREPLLLATMPVSDTYRFSSGIAEFDRVLGGGIIPGSLVLLGGDPGIGKSTLLLQMADLLGNQGKRVLYLSGEESAQQLKMRADRMGMKGSNVFVLNESNLDLINDYLKQIDPDLVVVDSIQTVYVPDIGSIPGSVSQLREAAARFMELAKSTDRPFFLVGHVTKEGSLAGPKILEHIVDTVIYFEGDTNNFYRILRAVKNRYGSVNEIGVMEMTGKGLLEVDNPSRIFMGDRARLPGSVVVATFEGTRSILVEVEALVAASGYGYPRRMASGIDSNRLALIAAVLEKRAGLALSNKDIYLKVAGGATLKDPATDLGIALAIASSYWEREVPNGSVVIGELGLSGEIRPVPYLEVRLREAEKLGLVSAVIPKDAGKDHLGSRKLELFEAETLDRALSYI